MNPCNLRVGSKVHWTDPVELDGDDENSSGEYRVVRTGTEDWTKTELREMGKVGRDELIVFCVNEAGGELECWPSELKLLT